MIILDGITKFLTFVNENWVYITTIISLAIAVGNKVRDYLNKTQEEKIEIAKAQINEVMLMLVTEAEQDYLQWVSAGQVKRSQVIDQVFAMYPILSKVTNQEEIIVWIDESIDNALKTMRKIFEENKEKSETVEAV